MCIAEYLVSFFSKTCAISVTHPLSHPYCVSACSCFSGTTTEVHFFSNHSPSLTMRRTFFQRQGSTDSPEGDASLPLEAVSVRVSMLRRHRSFFQRQSVSADSLEKDEDTATKKVSSGRFSMRHPPRSFRSRMSSRDLDKPEFWRIGCTSGLC